MAKLDELISFNEEGLAIVDHPVDVYELVAILRWVVADYVSGAKDANIPQSKIVDDIDEAANALASVANRMREEAALEAYVTGVFV